MFLMTPGTQWLSTFGIRYRENDSSRFYSGRNSNDCGVFAIIFEVSLLFNLQLDEIMYNHNLMHPHLTQIFELNRIEHLPCIIYKTKQSKQTSLNKVRKRKALTKRKREHRWININEISM